MATTLGRLYASMYYALKDTVTPLRYAMFRVFLTAVLGYVCALHLPPALGVDPRWGVAGLTASAGFCGWLELILLRNSLNRRIGRTGLSIPFIAQLWAAAGVAAAGGWVVKLMTGEDHPIGLAILSLGFFGTLYFIVTKLFRLPESTGLIDKVMGLAGLRW